MYICTDDGTCLPAGRLVEELTKWFKVYQVYVIRSKWRNYIYVGLMYNIQERLSRHNNGNNKTTSPYAPFDLIYVEDFPDRKAARQREKYLKSGVGKEFLKSL